MNHFKVGTNFDFELIKLFDSLNQKYDGTAIISEVYGSDRAHAALAARPDFRLPDIDFDNIKRYVTDLHEVGIGFNYTMNSIFPYGSKKSFSDHKYEIMEYIGKLQRIGIERITIANPIMLELIRNEMHCDIPIEISTIMHIDTVTQIKYLFEKYGVTKFCGNVLKNRDFNFIKSANAYCKQHGLIYELMANEFCGVGGGNYATHCVYRDSCYICHATNKTLDDANSFGEYPMKTCSFSRNEDDANWLKVRWIRPEDLPAYNEIGSHHFKITGRTGSTEYIKRTIESYMSMYFDGNLLNLWKPLESIKGEPEFDAHIDINNRDLHGFIDHWKSGKTCDNEVCGETCTYCDTYLRGVING